MNKYCICTFAFIYIPFFGCNEQNNNSNEYTVKILLNNEMRDTFLLSYDEILFTCESDSDAPLINRNNRALLPIAISIHSMGETLVINIDESNLYSIIEEVFTVGDVRIKIKFFDYTDSAKNRFLENSNKFKIYFDSYSYLEVITNNPELSIGYTWESSVFGKEEMPEQRFMLKKNMNYIENGSLLN